MSLQPKKFDPRQDMQHPDFELQYKRDMHLNDVGLHHHDFFEIFYLISGDVTYTVNSRICKVLPGDVLLISPRQLHQVYIRSDLCPYERYVLWLTPEIIRQLSTQHSDLMQALDPTGDTVVNQLRLKPEDQAHIKHLLSQIHQESQAPAYGSELLCTSLITQLLVHINRLADQEGDYFEAVSSSSQFISRIIDYINDHYHEPLSLDQLAAQFFVSKYHLSHEFIDPEYCFWATSEERYEGRYDTNKDGTVDAKDTQHCLGQGGCSYNAYIRDDAIRKRIHYHAGETTVLYIE